MNRITHERKKGKLLGVINYAKSDYLRN